MCRGAPVLVWVVLFLMALHRPALAEDFYVATAAELRGPPGTLIRFRGMPEVALTDAAAYRILYRSTGLRGEPIAVSGMAVVPFRAPPAGGWPVVAWAHGTTGIVPECAPSKMRHPMTSIVAIDALLAGRYLVATSDYPGLGAGTIHPYMVGESEGRAVLDAVRAARQLAAGRAGDRLAIFGHSQGGHAALWAGQMQPAYAPEFDLVGIAALAPATELGRLFDDDIDRLAGRILGALVMESWADPDVYGAPLDLLLARSEQPAFAEIGRNCIDLLPDELRDLRADKRIPADFLEASPTEVEPWRSLIARNIPPTRKAPAPLYIAQGTADTTVDPPVTRDFVRRLCAGGSVLRYEEFPGKTHGTIRKAAARTTVDWIRDRFEGKPAPNTC